MRAIEYGILLGIVMLPQAGFAALGQKPSASLSGEATLRAPSPTLRASIPSDTTAHGLYSATKHKLTSGTIVREFADAGGKVFAVAWRGPTRPDLQQLFGTYFSAYQQAAKEQLQHGGERRYARLSSSDLVVEMGGPMRNMFGFAYVPSLLPAGFNINDIRQDGA